MTRRALPLLLLALLASAAGAGEDGLSAARAIEAELIGVVERVRPAVVAVQAADPSAPPGPESRIRGGSGVIVSPEGLVLTNDHVAGGVTDAQVTLIGRRVIPAEVLGRNPGGDLALLRLTDPGPWPFVELGDSDGLKPGCWVLAMGNPRGVSRDGRAVVSFGMVSALHTLGGGGEGRLHFYGDAIQSDAEINPGNSGGPLFDLEGRLVGINGRIATRQRIAGSGVNAGVGFSIPASQIRRFLPLLAKGGVVRQGMLGVRPAMLGDGPVTAAWVRPGSAAERAGVRIGDELLALDGEPISRPLRLLNLVSSRPAGHRVALRIRRAGAERILVFALGERPGREP